MLSLVRSTYGAARIYVRQLIKYGPFDPTEAASETHPHRGRRGCSRGLRAQGRARSAGRLRAETQCLCSGASNSKDPRTKSTKASRKTPKLIVRPTFRSLS